MQHLLWICLILIGTIANANTIAVRTGEHADFTRVVLTIPEGTEWKVGRTNDGYGVVIPGATSFATSEFFDRIPKRRIIDFTEVASDDRLDLRVECECKVSAFLIRPDTLVVDVSDGVAATDSQFEATLERDLGPTSEPIVGFPIALQIELKPEASTVMNGEQSETIRNLLDPFATIVAQQESLIALEASIGDSLTRATAQGLLTRSSTNATPGPLVSETPATEISRPAEAEKEPVVEADPPGIRIQTSIDRDAPRIEPPGSVTQGGFTCWADSMIDVSSWGNGDDFGDQIGPLWSALTQEFDRTDPQIVESLAKNYVFFGFGREAQQILQIDGLQSQQRSIIISLAQIIDGDVVAPPVPARMMGCNGDVALWAMLGQSKRDLAIQPNRNAILRSLKSLPLQLQAHLGPIVANRFLEMGDIDAAEQALVGGDRLSDQSIEVALANVAVTAQRGQTEDVRNQLGTLADSNARMTPEALLNLIALNLQNGIVTPPDILTLAAAMRFENSGLPIAADLAVAEVEAHVVAQDFDAAARLLAQESEIIGDVRHAMLLDGLVAAATDDMLVPSFLTMAEEIRPADISNATSNAVAARLLEIGLPDFADAFLGAPAIGEDMAERRYLRAESALQKEDLLSVEPILAGIVSPRADALRTSVLARLAGYAVPNEPDIAQEDAAWRDGNWQDLSTSEDPLLLDATALILSDGQTAATEDTPLANGRALLAETAEMRAVVEGLLTRYTPPDDANALTN